MTSNWVSDDAPTPKPGSTQQKRAAAWRKWWLLAAIVLLGAYFNTINLFGWDGGTGQHPDERFMTLVADRIKAPTSLAEYLDSQRNPLNPRNAGYPFYVYGLLPQTLTHYTAVLLTPNAALPPTVPAARPHDTGAAPIVANPDLRVPKLVPLQALLNPSGQDLTNYYAVVKVGRIWSALFATLSIVVVFLLGRRLYGARAGLIAALLLALSALPIQLAHFFTVDSATVLFTLVAIYWAVRLAQNGGLPSALLLGLSIGAAMACRVTMATLGMLAVLALAQRLLDQRIAPDAPTSDVYYLPARRRLSLAGGLALVALAGLVTIITFRMLQPDAFVGTSFFDLRPDPRFIANIREIGAAVSGSSDSPPSQQWAGRIRYLFALQNMVVWGMGLPLGLAAWLAWAVAGVQLARAAWRGWSGHGWGRLHRRLGHLIPWFWVGFYFAWQGGQLGMTMRYFTQLYGLLALFAGWALARTLSMRLLLSDWRPRRAGWYNLQAVARWVPVVLVVAGTLAWAYAFTRIYTRPHSRISASRWMYEHIPAGAAVTSEQWDDALPLSVDGRRAFDPQAGGWYYNVETYPYAEDDRSKYFGSTGQDGAFAPGLLDHLDQADYIVLSSNRVYGSATRLPMRYPALTRYYHSLFDGELGFVQVADISSYPTLFGIAIPDQGAEEAFSVYDHPRVLIFKKTSAYSRANAERLITGEIAWTEVYKLPTLRGGQVPTALRLTDTQWPSYRDAGSFAALFNPAGLSNRLPWLFWLLALELLGLALFALLFRRLPGLPDRGFALAKALALLLVAYAAWLLGSLRLVPFGPGSAWLCAGLLIASGVVAGWRARAEIWEFVRRRRAALISAEGLFLVAYAGFVLIRALNPDLWHPARGGEKPMDLAFLTAVVKSAYFPPYDPWFAGGYINYYYFGFVLVGTLVHLTGIVPTTAYNLAVPTLFALTALGAWGVGYNLLAFASGTAARGLGANPARAEAPGSAPLALPASVPRRSRARRAIRARLAAAVCVVLLGPLTQALWYLPGSATPAFEGLPAECNVSSYAAQQACRGRAEWAFWDATRLVGMDLQDSTINEFPFFTFLFADLHAHMIALPLALLALGLMVALVQTEHRPPRTGHTWRRTSAWLLVLGALALVLGALRATNTWDFPTYFALSCATLGLISWRRWLRGAALGPTALGWLLALLALLLGSTLLFLPFLRSFATDYAGFEIWRGARTSAADFLRINGLWLFLLLSGAVLLYRRRGVGWPWLLLIGGGPLLLAVLALALKAGALVLIVPLAIVAIGCLVDHMFEYATRSSTPRALLAAQDSSEPYMQLVLPLGELPRSPSGQAGAPAGGQPRVSVATLLTITWALFAVLIALATELVVARGDVGRMNTVFKLGMQSWTLFALAAALTLSTVWPALGARSLRALGWAWRGVAVLLIAAALVYPLSATPARLADRIDDQIGPTLDGLAFMRSPKGTWAENNQQFGFAQDADALDWMRAHVAGSPIVLEAHTEAYRWGGRVATYTGLPTLLGWPWHETQQRQVANVGPVLAGRQALIQQLYAGTDPAVALRQLRLFGVEYVYVGQLERALYPAAGLAKFDALAQAGQISQVYSAGATRIYQLPRAESAPAVTSTTLAVRPAQQTTPQGTRLDAPVHTLPAVPEYAWNQLAQAQPVALALWLLAGYLLLALGLPISALVFGRLAARRPEPTGAGGWAWARLIGLLLFGYLVWLPVSMGLWPYNRWSLLWALVLLLLLNAALLAWIGRAAGARPALPGGARALLAHLHTHWRAILLSEALFLGAFAFMALLRAYNPDLWQPYWGGEKPFEFGFLNAILRSPVMPPYDPFMSDARINYYYYGLFLASLPIKATGIAPAVGFNLVIATLFALTLAGAFALVARLTGRLRYGLAGGAFVVLLGNLAAAFPVGWGQGLAPVRAALADGLAGFGERLGSWFVGPSRVIVIPDRLVTINEFPLWSYLFADLHPHLIAMPIAILLTALAYELFDARAGAAGRPGWLPGGSRWLLAALTLGALAVTNSWDLPTYALVIGGALLGRAWRGVGRTSRQLARAMAGALAQAAGVVLGALLLYLPFFQNYVRPAGVSGIGLVRDGSPLSGFVLIYGLYLLILGLWLFGVAARLWRDVRRPAPTRALGPAEAEQNALLGIVARPPTAGGAWMNTRTALIVVGLVLLAGLLSNAASAARIWASPLLLKAGLIALLAAGLPVLLARRLPRRVWFIAWLAVAAWLVALGVELVYIRDHLDGGESYRMNTVFKFGLQAWILMALAAASALPCLARGLRRAGAAAQVFGWGMIAALVGLALVFPLAGIPSRLAYRFPQAPGPTLDGLAFMQQAEFDMLPEYLGQQSGPTTRISLKDDLDAIRWINQNIEGTPIVLQSDLWFYRAYGVRVAANTGLPTVVSPLHANEQHDPELVAERDLDVQQIYYTLDQGQALRLLAKYHVAYVYVGQIERAAYGAAGLAKFDTLVGTYLTLAYQNPTVRLYQVNPGVFALTSAAEIAPPPARPQPAAPAEPPANVPASPATLAALEQQVAADPAAAGPAFELAQRYRALQRLDDAAAILQVAAQANPNDVALQQLWGDTLRDAGRNDEAESAYRAAVAANPSAGNYNKLGAELLRAGKPDRAAEALLAAIEADPNAAEPYFHLGQVYEQQGRTDQAIEQYRSYLTIAKPTDSFYQEATAALGRLGR